MKLFNSLTQKKELFTPIKKNNATLYVCGITPYDTTHLGHAFSYIFFDTLLRYLHFQDITTVYSQNVTDINDRDNDILKRSQEQQISWKKLARYWTTHFLNDMQKLNWTMPDNYLFASKHIPQMVTLIEELLLNGLAYQKAGGVYLDIKKDKDFGKLSRLTKKEMLKIAKEFEEDTENKDKKNPLDLTLWRSTQKDQPSHIPSFTSPFGNGRPGWHIECSAMAISSLGEQIDIHGGGIDLLYPHHESEIAQSEGATKKKPFAKYWMHTALVHYQGKKMSKSLGNLLMVSDLLKNYSPNALRFLLLSHHYRETWEFHEEKLALAQKNIDFIEQKLNQKNGEKEKEKGKEEGYRKQFFSCMDDDMRTPDALSLLTTLAEDTTDNTKTLTQLFNLLGFTSPR